MKRPLLLALGLALLTSGVAAAPPAAVSFERDITPLFAQKCAACHLRAGSDAGLILEPRLAYLMIVDVLSTQSTLKRVAPGAPERSYLLLKMQNLHRAVGGTGTKMPPGWFTATPAEIALVRAWIAAGAPNN